jgi:hypothetical protein
MAVVNEEPDRMLPLTDGVVHHFTVEAEAADVGTLKEDIGRANSNGELMRANDLGSEGKICGTSYDSGADSAVVALDPIRKAMFVHLRVNPARHGGPNATKFSQVVLHLSLLTASRL